jgi:hypothetical protein
MDAREDWQDWTWRRVEFEVAVGLQTWGGRGRFHGVFVFVKPAWDGVKPIYFDGVVGGSQTHLVRHIF